ncbi:MAG: hypothetical protein AB9Q23_11730 [Candidatus Reddybacter sp.]
MIDLSFSKVTNGKAGLAKIIAALSFSFIIFLIPVAQAHHVLGRPAYSLNEDSNTPPSMNIETLVGDFFVTAMVFPAFPKPEESGRINLYVTRLGTKQPLNADIEFSVRNDGWFNSIGFDNKAEQLGAQVLDDNVYRQAFSFHQRGDYIISASFWDKGEHYIIDFPLRVGEPLPIGPLGIIVTFVLLLLIVVTVVQRKKILRNKSQVEITARTDKQAS